MRMFSLCQALLTFVGISSPRTVSRSYFFSCLKIEASIFFSLRVWFQSIVISVM
jgi:hypothetical protein